MQSVASGPVLRARRAATPFGAIAAVARRAAQEATLVQWPATRWANDPVGFAREVLDTELWSAQLELLEAIRDDRNVSCRSGHKCGKTTVIAIAALWFYATFPRARVLCTAVKAPQIEKAIWVELRRLVLRSRTQDERRGWVAPFPIDGKLNDTARGGLIHADGRQVWGATARTTEGLAGISGPNVMILADEASGISDPFFDVLGTAIAGSGGTVKKVYISNPTKTAGEFYRSHTKNAHLFRCVHISSEDTPNARGETIIPGLCGPEYIAEKKLEWGEDSPSYRIRIKGEFVRDLDGKIISLNLISDAQSLWDETPDEGDIQLGIDPAGDGVIGDETAIAFRRGKKIVTVRAWRSLTEDAIVANAIGMLRELRRANDPTPRIAVDVEGGIGTRVAGKLRVHLAQSGEFELVPVRSGKKMWGSPEFDLVRDALWGTMAKFLKAGGAIPEEDGKLADELNAPSFTADKNQRYCATPKKELRKLLGRSPDRGDAACLAVWRFEAVEPDEKRQNEELAGAAPRGGLPDTVSETDDDAFDPGNVFDPYGGAG